MNSLTSLIVASEGGAGGGDGGDGEEGAVRAGVQRLKQDFSMISILENVCRKSDMKVLEECCGDVRLRVFVVSIQYQDKSLSFRHAHLSTFPTY